MLHPISEISLQYSENTLISTLKWRKLGKDPLLQFYNGISQLFWEISLVPILMGYTHKLLLYVDIQRNQCF